MQTQNQAENTQGICDTKSIKEQVTTRLDYQISKSLMLKILWVIKGQQYDYRHNNYMMYKRCNSREYDKIPASSLLTLLHVCLQWVVCIKYSKIASGPVPN